MKTTQIAAVFVSAIGSVMASPNFPSGSWSGYGPWGTNTASWAPSVASAASAFRSYASAHPTGWESSDYSSFTSMYGPMPTEAPWGPGGPGGPGGPWGSGPGGFHGGHGGPFRDGGWGPWNMNGSWTSGAWTSWWGGDKCPPSTWSGWTDGPWSTNAPWTTWTACSATTTAASTYTTTSDGVVSTGTSFGYQVAQAQQTGNAAPAGKTVANGAAALAFIGAVLVA